MNFRGSLTLLLFLLSCGCSSEQIPSSSIAASQSSYDEGIAAFEASDFSTADAGLTNAISNSGLDPDQMADALLKRAVARKELGQLEEALADVAAAEPGAPDLSVVYQIRGNIRIAQGDLAAAKQNYAEAKKLNPRIQLPAELK